jgi:dihydrolipoamide dehydrogenase
MKNYDAIVIGAGPGGYVCAIRLAQLGKKTAIVEKEFFGGVCLNVGCIPSKALIHASKMYHNMSHEASEMGFKVSSPSVDMNQLQKWKNTIVKKLTDGVSGLLKMNKVDSFKGTATFKDSKTIEVKTANGVETLSASNFVVATGSRIIELPNFPFDGKKIINSTQALDLNWIPKKFAVIGGGFIGIEIGIVFAKLGSKVTIIEASPNILSTTDRDLVAVVEKKMKKLGIEVLTNTKADKIDADCILVSVGRVPNSDNIGLEKLGVKLDARKNIQVDSQGKTNVPGIYAIGDVTGAPQLAHRASMDGLIVAAAISGENAHKDYKTVPWAIFSDPEIAVVGLTEKEAQEKGFKTKIGKFPFAASGRALSTNETDGFIKVIINEKDESILGVHMVGPEVSNLIAEATLAIEMGATFEDVARTIHTHPTLPEAFAEAVENAYGKSIHVYKPTRN